MVVVTRDTESCLFTTARDYDTIVVGLTKLRHFVYPVSILIKVAEISGVRILLIHDFGDTGLFVREFTRVMIGFFKHHGVAVTVEHLHAFGLPGAGETITEVDLRLTAGTTAGGNFNYTV